MSWKTKNITKVYENPWIEVTHREVVTPNQTDAIYGVVHFKNRAIGVLVIDDQERVGLVGQSRYPLDSYSWEIPEGGGPLNEDPLSAAKRELKEETGCVAVHWRQFMTMHLSNSVTDEEAVVFIATELTEGQAEPEDSEDLSCRWVSLPAALGMIESGEITDAITVAALYRYAYEQSKVV